MDNKTTFVNLVRDFKIDIPRIQRDYVQGRAVTPEQNEKRKEFVSSLITALEDTNEACVLDFIYGFIQGEEGSKTFIPLDGQQRLTSLFLLHWFLLYRIHKERTDANVFGQEEEYLKHIKGRFLYSNRMSSTEFCERITSFEERDFNFKIKGSVTDVLKQQAWFDDEWIFDPTIETMLSMLRVYETELEKKNFQELTSMTIRLFEEKAIYFDMLNLEELHQGESLYVKMNARGKKLTPFENWKSKFTKMLDELYHNQEFEDGDRNRCGVTFKDYFSYSIEHDWNDFFWRFVTKDMKMDSQDDVIKSSYPTVDRAFTNFLKFLHSLLFFEQRNNKGAKITDFQWTFAQNIETYGQCPKNLVFLFQCLDFIAAIPDPETYFSDLFYFAKDNSYNNTDHKVRRYEPNKINLLTLAIGSYVKEDNKIVNNRDDSSKFDLTSAYLLYAVLKHAAPSYCKKRTEPKVDEALRFYIRNCRNYLENKNQFLTAKVSLSPDIRITDAKDLISNIDKLNNGSLYSDSQVQRLYEWLGDIEYIGGDADAFHPILDGIQNGSSTISCDMVTKFITAFDQASTLQRVQMLIGAGYQGKSKIGGVGENRERIFFGENVRWNVLFVEDNKSMSYVLSKLILDYDSCNGDIGKLLDYYRTNARPNTFVYYMLTYNYALWAPNDPKATIDGAKDGLYFFAVSGKLDDMDLIALKSISVQPLSAYHIDPLVCAVLHECSPTILNHLNYIGRFGTKRGFFISENDEDVFEMTSISEGWSLKTDKKNWLSGILSVNQDLSYSNKVFQLKDDVGIVSDKVVIGKMVLEALSKHLSW